jgi:hypothetical protein
MIIGRYKHIYVRYYFLRDLSKDAFMELYHYRTEDQIVDVMTKPLKRESFCKFEKMLRVSYLNIEFTVFTHKTIF